MKKLEQIQAEIILSRLDFHKGNKTATARSLGISLKGLINKLVTYGLHERTQAVPGRPPKYSPKKNDRVSEYIQSKIEKKEEDDSLFPPLTEAEIKQREKERFIYLNGNLEGWRG